MLSKEDEEMYLTRTSGIFPVGEKEMRTRHQERSDRSHRETDQFRAQMGCRRITPINTRNLPSPDNTDPMRKKGNLDSSVLAGGVEERATHKVMHPGGSLLTPRQHSLSEQANIG